MPQSDVQSDSTKNRLGSQLRLEVAHVSLATIVAGTHTVTFQPRKEYPSEDRHLVQDWKLSNGVWKFIAVFDGHGAGHEAVDFVRETLPSMIKTSLSSIIDKAQNENSSASTVEETLVECISAIDDRIKADVLEFFPGGLDEIFNLTDDEIEGAITDPETGNSYLQIMRARTGTTALVALIDPLKCLYVASLGDCEAFLGTQNSLGEWEMKTLSKRHNASNEMEADRVRAEHPAEAECIVQARTLGLITLTRAIGDTMFKLPAIYTERVFAHATPPFHVNYQVDQLIARNLTPPYLSNRAEVEYVNLASLEPYATPVLVLCSDGLTDLYSRRSKTNDIANDVQRWLTMRKTGDGRVNLALDLLWDALGVDSGAEAASRIIRGVPGRRVDDTTILVLEL